MPQNHNAGMRRPVVKIHTARAVISIPRRRFFQAAVSRRSSEKDNIQSIPTSETATGRTKELRFPYKFETGLALFAKRSPRPFPPPFLSPPSGSFSEPLSTHNRSRDRTAFVNGELIRGWTNGDDAVYGSDFFVAANDGVGAWSTRPGGHAG